jgi:hypothetical protein
MEKEAEMPDFTPEEEGSRPGEAVVFWSCVGVMSAGLIFMLAIPLMGR